MKCIIVSTTRDVAELRSLADSAGHEVLRVFVQKRKRPDPKYYIGSGKANEIKEYISGSEEANLRGDADWEEDIEEDGYVGEEDEDTANTDGQSPWDEGLDRGPETQCVLFNNALKPSQQCALERKLGVQVWDRLWLILEIFKERARSKEAMLQVELARRRYEIPLLKEWVHRARKGEHPGYMAGGAYEVDQYLEFIRRRERLLKEKLEALQRQRGVRRSSRRDREVYMVSLTGYTNSGKSSILQNLTGEEVVVEDRMFSTLGTTTRKVLGTNRPVLLTDTVGFIHDLPPWLVDAFRSTLEEVFEADTILLVFDISEPYDIIEKKLETCNSILLPDTRPSSIIHVANKTDLLSNQELTEKLQMLEQRGKIFPVSAKKEEGLDSLIEHILMSHAFPLQAEVVLENHQQKDMHWLYENTLVLQRQEDEEKVLLKIAYTERDSDHVEKLGK